MDKLRPNLQDESLTHGKEENPILIASQKTIGSHCWKRKEPLGEPCDQTLQSLKAVGKHKLVRENEELSRSSKILKI